MADENQISDIKRRIADSLIKESISKNSINDSITDLITVKDSLEPLTTREMFRKYGAPVLEYFTIPALKAELKVSGQRVSGNKPELIARLSDAWSSNAKKRKHEDTTTTSDASKKKKPNEIWFVVKLHHTHYGACRYAVRGDVAFEATLEEMLEVGLRMVDTGHQYSVNIGGGRKIASSLSRDFPDYDAKRKPLYGDKVNFSQLNLENEPSLSVVYDDAPFNLLLEKTVSEGYTEKVVCLEKTKKRVVDDGDGDEDEEESDE